MDRNVNQSSHNKEHGQSLVEFAVMLTLLLIMVAGIVDAARALFTYLSMRDAAQEGALYASTRPTDTAGIEARVRNASNMLSNLGGAILRVIGPWLPVSRVAEVNLAIAFPDRDAAFRRATII